MRQNSKNITLDGLYVNATNHDPAEPTSNPNNGSLGGLQSSMTYFFVQIGRLLGNDWVVNTDGVDTYRSDQITIKNWVIQNGDDCVAFKGYLHFWHQMAISDDFLAEIRRTSS